ncbi:hypothetical protein GCM10009839_14780 [Catenulispora yoronensis]|uniref:Lipoprotein n=1 Tax=Catenulispora yoronensis TaxID=450799 RepID=A0ABP5F8D7_9ACTN
MRDQLMRQRTKLLVGGMLSAAVIGWGVTACSHDDHERCVDTRDNTVIADSYCTDLSSSYGYAHWYRGGSGFTMGSKAGGGEVGEHGVARGGFGGHGGDGGHGG